MKRDAEKAARIGIVDVASSTLHIMPQARLNNQKRINKPDLYKSFHGKKGSRSGIVALVNSRAECDILEKLKLDRDALKVKNSKHQFPTLEISQHKITCLNGQQRMFSQGRQKKKWRVELYCFEQVTNKQSFIEKYTECRFQEKRYSDAHVYQEIRSYEKNGEKHLAQIWRDQLSLKGRAAIKDKNLQKLLNRLSDRSPTLLKGLKLADFHTDRHCDGEILRGLTHLCATWDSMPPIKVDIGTLKLLQGRAPAASKADHAHITSKMKEGKLFPELEDHIRNKIMRTILDFEGVIPSMETFLESLKYYQIGVSIIIDLLVDDPKDARSTQEVMEACWKSPPEFVVEVREGIFTTTGEGVHARVAYLQLLLSALRQSSRLSYQHRACNPAYVSLFLSRAHRLGFRTHKIENRLTEPCVEIVADYPIPPDSAADGMTWKHRMSRTCTNTYKRLRSELFLPNLYGGNRSEPMEISVFVQRDILRVFLDLTKDDLDKVRAAVGKLIDPIESTTAQRVSRPLERPACSCGNGDTTSQVSHSQAKIVSPVSWTPEHRSSSSIKLGLLRSHLPQIIESSQHNMGKAARFVKSTIRSPIHRRSVTDIEKWVGNVTDAMGAEEPVSGARSELEDGSERRSRSILNPYGESSLGAQRSEVERQSRSILNPYGESSTGAQRSEVERRPRSVLNPCGESSPGAQRSEVEAIKINA